MIREQYSNTCATICLVLFLIGGAAHITFGGLYINWGSYLANASGRHWDYVENLPLGSFTIVVGGMFVLAVVWLRITMNSKMEPSGEFAYWFVTLMMGVLNFAVAFMMIREFVYSDKRHTKLGIAIPSYWEFTSQYYFGLADGIYSFIVLLPATIQLMYLANYRMAEASFRNRIMIDPSPNPAMPQSKAKMEQIMYEKESLMQERNETGAKRPPMGKKEVELQANKVPQENFQEETPINKEEEIPAQNDEEIPENQPEEPIQTEMATNDYKKGSEL